MEQLIKQIFIKTIFLYILIFFATPNLQAARDYTPPPVERKVSKDSKKRKINRKKLRLNFKNKQPKAPRKNKTYNFFWSDWKVILLEIIIVSMIVLGFIFSVPALYIIGFTLLGLALLILLGSWILRILFVKGYSS